MSNSRGVRWYSEASLIEGNPSSRAELSDITYEPCPPLAPEAGTSHHPVRSVSSCHQEIDSSLCLGRRRLRYNCVIKGDGLDSRFRLKPRTEYGSVNYWGTDERIVEAIQAPDQRSLSNITVKAQSEATHGPSRSLKLMELVTHRPLLSPQRYFASCGTSESLCRVSTSAFDPALAVTCREALYSGLRLPHKTLQCGHE